MLEINPRLVWSIPYSADTDDAAFNEIMCKEEITEEIDKNGSIYPAVVAKGKMYKLIVGIHLAQIEEIHNSIGLAMMGEELAKD